MTQRPVRILLIEDSEADTILATRVLQQFDVDIETANDAEAAERLLFEQGLRPELILLDLSLPGVHGLDVLRKIKNDARTQDVKVVIVTGNEAEQIAMKAYNLRCDGIVHKPITLDSVRELLRKMRDEE